MHAARAINKNREKREEKAKNETRRHSAISHIDWSIPRSPGTSLDAAARRAQHEDKGESGYDIDTGSHSHSLIPNSATLPRQRFHHHHDSTNLNFSYIGFIIAVFGAVPLIVGTFVEVPALWEIGLGVTLVGLFIGIVFWCTELCAEAKKFAQKKNQLSTRGKIEDSNLLQVPERKFGNGMESRRGSFQSDSVSLITPTAQHYERNPANNPQHHQFHPNNFPHLHNTERKHSMSQSQYSSTKSDESSATTLQYYGSIRNNGNIIGPPPPRLLLRGSGRKDDSRVVSLVQPDPGLDDGDSDSDAETVIEAPTGRPKIIQVQSQIQGQHHHFHHHRHHSDPDTFTIENESLSPLNPMAAQHRTIRMPVMPQEVEKLQRCECGRYLLTERDKLLGIKLSKLGQGECGTAIYNSPTLVAPGGFIKVFNSKGEVVTPDSTTSSDGTNNEPYSPNDDLTPQSPDPPQVINVYPASVMTSGGTLTKSHHSGGTKRTCNHEYDNDADGDDNYYNNSDYDSDTLKKIHTPKVPQSSNESVVEVEPNFSASDLLTTAAEVRTENAEVMPPTSQVAAGGRFTNQRDTGEDVCDGKAVSKFTDEMTEKSIEPSHSISQENLVMAMTVMSAAQSDDKGAGRDIYDDDDEFADSHKPEEARSPPPPTRPTYLPLPVMLTESVMSSQQGPPEMVEITSGLTSSSSCSSASTVVFLGGPFPTGSMGKPSGDADKDTEPKLVRAELVENKGKRETVKREVSLEELLDKIEQNPDDVLAVVVS